MLVNATELEPIKMNISSIPKRTKYGVDELISEKQAAQDAKQITTVATFTATGEHILTGTNKGWLNVVDVKTRTVIYSTKICAGVVIFMRLTGSGRDLVVNCQDRIIRTIQLPDLSGTDLDPDTIDIEIEHKFQDVINRLSWNHVAFSATGEYVTASTYNNHDIYIWERNHGSLVKILEGPKEEHGMVEWHPHKPLIVACGLETGRIHMWSIIPQQRWSALAPDFVEVEENVEYVEREDEFDIHPKEEIHRRRLDLEDHEVDVLKFGPVKGVGGEDGAWRMPVELDIIDSEAEEEFIAIGRGEMRRKDATRRRDYSLDAEVGGLEEKKKKPRSSKR